jgi:hypothetical protein
MNDQALGFLIMTVAIPIVLIVWLLPSIIAVNRGHKHAAAIVVANLLFGLNGVGWRVALVWAFTDKR